MKKPRPTFRRVCLGLIPVLPVVGLAAPGLATEVSESQLPPPASVQIDFTRDIKPIFQTSCLRCHGPERPKNGFRLDNRQGAIKGGDNGVDVIVGNSARSPLIHYVARLVPDLEMPPEGRGDPLTKEQVGLLRAWIDQGAAWENAVPTNLLDVTLAPTFGWTAVSGDNGKFREQYWQRDGPNGGLDRFQLLEQPNPDTRITASGHALLDDYKIVLNADRNELGFIHSGWAQFRQYYDDAGGYLPSHNAPPPQRLGTELYLDTGKAWIDFGLTLPQWPKLVLGYEYDYKRGQEAITSWGAQASPTGPHNLDPASKSLDEGTHVINLDMAGNLKGIDIEDRFRGEFYSLNTHYTNLAARGPVSQNASESDHYFQGANSIGLERRFKEWLFGSAGYFYSKLNADDSFSDAIGFNNALFAASAPRILLERESHIINLTTLLGPFHGLTLSVGAQAQWTHQQGLGGGNLNGIQFTRLPPGSLTISPASLASDYQQQTTSETAGLRYSKIPFTSVFADARFQQESIDQSDSDIQSQNTFLEQPSFTRQLTDIRAGFATSPWQSLSFTAHYRRYEDDSRYQTNQIPQPMGGYPGFISARDLITDEIEAKLVYHPFAWLKLTLSYQFLTTDFKQDTRSAFDPVSSTLYSQGGWLLAGRSGSDIYSFGATFNPWRRLALSGTFSYQSSRTTTASAGLIPPYEGGIYSALSTATYSLNSASDLSLNYSFSLADYTQGNSSANPESPPPLGISYQQHALKAAFSRRVGKNLTTRLQYGFYYYDEPTLAGASNYRAHMVSGTLTYRFR